MSTSQAAQIASTLVSFLAPFTPYLVKGAEGAAKAAGKKLRELGSEAMWEKAKTVRSKITNRFKDDEELQRAATLVARQPENETRQAMLAEILAERLKDNPTLVKELATLLAEEPQEVVPGSIIVSGSGAFATQGSLAGGEGSIVAGGDVHISTSSLPKDDKPPSIPSGVGTGPPATEVPEALAATIADAVINDRPAGYFVWTSSSHLDPGST